MEQVDRHLFVWD